MGVAASFLSGLLGRTGEGLIEREEKEYGQRLRQAQAKKEMFKTIMENVRPDNPHYQDVMKMALQGITAAEEPPGRVGIRDVVGKGKRKPQARPEDELLQKIFGLMGQANLAPQPQAEPKGAPPGAPASGAQTPRDLGIAPVPTTPAPTEPPNIAPLPVKPVGFFGREEYERQAATETELDYHKRLVEMDKQLRATWAKEQNLPPDIAQRYVPTGDFPPHTNFREGRIEPDPLNPGMGRVPIFDTITGGILSYRPALLPTSQTGTVETSTSSLTGETISKVRRPLQPAGTRAIREPLKEPSGPRKALQSKPITSRFSPAIAATAASVRDRKEKMPSGKIGLAVREYMKEAGWDVPTQISATEQVIVDQAEAIQTMGRNLMAALPELRDDLGVFAGRVSEVQLRIGSASPALRQFYSELYSFYSAQGKLHGWRAIRVTEEFQKALNVMASGEEGAKASILGSIAAAQAFAQAYRREQRRGSSSSIAEVPGTESRPKTAEELKAKYGVK